VGYVSSVAVLVVVADRRDRVWLTFRESRLVVRRSRPACHKQDKNHSGHGKWKGTSEATSRSSSSMLQFYVSLWIDNTFVFITELSESGVRDE
jgi:hypothetical protein